MRVSTKLTGKGKIARQIKEIVLAYGFEYKPDTLSISHQDEDGLSVYHSHGRINIHFDKDGDATGSEQGW